MITSRRTCLQLAGLASTSLFAETMDADPLSWFARRQSVRAYKSTPVPEDHLRRILDAARRAPTSGNQQPWRFLVIRDPAKIERLRTACVERNAARYTGADREARIQKMREAFAGYLSAPVYIVVLTDSQSEYPTYNQHDGPLAAGYLMLAARMLGYGTVYITDAIPDEVTRSVLSIPERFQRVCITPLGVPAAWPDPKPKKKLDDLVAFETL